MYVIAGVTGNTGAAAADALLDQGHPVRVIVRDATKGEAWKTKGADVAIADLNDVPAMTEALRDAKGAYLLLPPIVTEPDILLRQEQLAHALFKSVEASGVPHVVFLSSVGAHIAQGTGPIQMVRKAEQVFASSSARVTFLRPCYFMENWGAVLQPVLEQGVLPSFLQPLDRPVDMIATRDIGLKAAEALVNDAPAGFQELRGPKAYSPEEIAATLSGALGRQITAVQVDPADWVPSLTAAGLSQDMAQLLEEMNHAINEGVVDFETDNVSGGQTGFDRVAAALTAA